MPIKYNLTKYDLLFSKIKRAALKKDKKEMNGEDLDSMTKAVIVAAFASGHSWQTFKTLTSPTSISFNTPEIRKEHSQAVAVGWKSISPFDIHEVANTNIPDSAFSQWLFFAVEKEHHAEYERAWSELKKEFEEDCDNIERAAYVR